MGQILVFYYGVRSVDEYGLDYIIESITKVVDVGKSSHTIEYGLWTRFYEVCTRLNNTKNHRVVDFL